MGDYTAKERMARFRAERKAAGLKRLELWAKPKHHAPIRQYAEHLEDEDLPDEIDISIGWFGDDLSITVYSGDDEIASAKYPLADICDEPAQHWHHSGRVDAEHHGYITAITERLEEQAARLRAVLAGLTIQD